MKLELKYETDFDKSWEEIKNYVETYLAENDCITDKGEIRWPCYVYITKREKEPFFKH